MKQKQKPFQYFFADKKTAMIKFASAIQGKGEYNSKIIPKFIIQLPTTSHSDIRHFHNLPNNNPKSDIY